MRNPLPQRNDGKDRNAQYFERVLPHAKDDEETYHKQFEAMKLAFTDGEAYDILEKAGHLGE